MVIQKELFKVYMHPPMEFWHCMQRKLWRLAPGSMLHEFSRVMYGILAVQYMMGLGLKL